MQLTLVFKFVAGKPISKLDINALLKGSSSR